MAEEVVAALRPQREAGTMAEEEEACWTERHSAEPPSIHRELVASLNGRSSVAVEVMEEPSQAPEHVRPST